MILSRKLLVWGKNCDLELVKSLLIDKDSKVQVLKENTQI